jgi:hypothetical protein
MQYFIMLKAQILGMGGTILSCSHIHYKKKLNVVLDYRSTFIILA